MSHIEFSRGFEMELPSLRPRSPQKALAKAFGTTTAPSEDVVRLKASSCPAPLYLVTNEVRMETVVTELKELPPCGNALIGVSGLQNLDYFVAREGVHTLFIIDPHPLQEEFWNIIRNCMCYANGPEEAISFIRNAAKKQFFAEMGSDKIEQFLLYLERPDNAFRVPGGFEKIKTAAEDDRLIYVNVNLQNIERVRAFGKSLADHGFEVDTVYFSNIHERIWLGEKDTLAAVHALQDANKASHSEMVTIFTGNPKRDSSLGALALMCDCSTSLSSIPFINCTTSEKVWGNARAILREAEFYIRPSIYEGKINYEDYMEFDYIEIADQVSTLSANMDRLGVPEETREEIIKLLNTYLSCFAFKKPEDFNQAYFETRLKTTYPEHYEEYIRSSLVDYLSFFSFVAVRVLESVQGILSSSHRAEDL